mgnify:CR=1 FL=1
MRATLCCVAGFLSGDFGVHPVVTLVRGLITMLSAHNVTVICYSLSDQGSWWRDNITSAVTVRFATRGSSCHSFRVPSS